MLGLETTWLIKAARNGDRNSLEALYSRHQGRLLHFIRARMPTQLANRIAPEDVLQETLLESSRKIDDFESRGPASFYRWLVAIARFKLADAVRAQRADKRGRERPLEDPVPADQTSVSGSLLRTERAEILQAALASMPGQQGEAVRLRYLEGLSVAETAQRLGCSEPAVKALVSRCLMALADRLPARD